MVVVAVVVADTDDYLPSAGVAHAEQESLLDGIVWKDLECVSYYKKQVFRSSFPSHGRW
jgi:hypothetical protein